jgi:hypothetical protein
MRGEALLSDRDSVTRRGRTQADTPLARLHFDRFELDEAEARPARKVDTSKQETGCTVHEPIFATMEEVRYADELRLRLRARLLRVAAPVKPWCVGAD